MHVSKNRTVSICFQIHVFELTQFDLINEVWTNSAEDVLNV